MSSTAILNFVCVFKNKHRSAGVNNIIPGLGHRNGKMIEKAFPTLPLFNMNCCKFSMYARLVMIVSCSFNKAAATKELDAIFLLYSLGLSIFYFRYNASAEYSVKRGL